MSDALPPNTANTLDQVESKLLAEVNVSRMELERGSAATGERLAVALRQFTEFVYGEKSY